jgi:hypothetical protein
MSARHRPFDQPDAAALVQQSGAIEQRLGEGRNRIAMAARNMKAPVEVGKGGWERPERVRLLRQARYKNTRLHRFPPNYEIDINLIKL